MFHARPNTEGKYSPCDMYKIAGQFAAYLNGIAAKRWLFAIPRPGLKWILERFTLYHESTGRELIYNSWKLVNPDNITEVYALVTVQNEIFAAVGETGSREAVKDFYRSIIDALLLSVDGKAHGIEALTHPKSAPRGIVLKSGLSHPRTT